LKADQLFKVLVRAMTCRHDAVDGDICCRCGFRVEQSGGPFSEDQSPLGALSFLEVVDDEGRKALTWQEIEDAYCSFRDIEFTEEFRQHMRRRLGFVAVRLEDT
jgi:hypothetical protein